MSKSKSCGFATLVKFRVAALAREVGGQASQKDATRLEVQRRWIPVKAHWPIK